MVTMANTTNNTVPARSVSDTSIQAVREEIAHRCDGPLTAFVLITRACDAVVVGIDPEVAANALYEELRARNMLSEGNVEVPGS